MMINCPKCKASRVTDTTEVCPHCGFEIARFFREKRDAEEKNRKARMKYEAEQPQQGISPGVILIPGMIIAFLAIATGGVAGGILMLVLAFFAMALAS